MRRIGLYGGSFDPVHDAHLALARTALEHLQLDELRWIPVGDAWHKERRLSPAEDRAAMVSLAIADEPRFVLERCELERQGPSYTIDTVRQLKAAQQAHAAEWFLVMGQDQYGKLHTWHDWRALLPEVAFAVASRDGAPPVASAELAALPHRAVVLPLPRIDVSSTDIRRRVAAGQGISSMVPPAVASYIDRHHLYRGTPGS
ncbi:MAG TPA: nicotinate-nucleotide adenylyltransferase [Albitalea sp.]|uniref:nicotinate-nucleotide adenylyltransferase n=1 Tax=Piscinibacter sp. TaxID=1903157 RepID=UPI002ED2D3F6